LVIRFAHVDSVPVAAFGYTVRITPLTRFRFWFGYLRARLRRTAVVGLRYRARTVCVTHDSLRTVRWFAVCWLLVQVPHADRALRTFWFIAVVLHIRLPHGLRLTLRWVATVAHAHTPQFSSQFLPRVLRSFTGLHGSRAFAHYGTPTRAFSSHCVTRLRCCGLRALSYQLRLRFPGCTLQFIRTAVLPVYVTFSPRLVAAVTDSYWIRLPAPLHVLTRAFTFTFGLRFHAFFALPARRLPSRAALLVYARGSWLRCGSLRVTVYGGLPPCVPLRFRTYWVSITRTLQLLLRGLRLPRAARLRLRVRGCGSGLVTVQFLYARHTWLLRFFVLLLRGSRSPSRGLRFTRTVYVRFWLRLVGFTFTVHDFRAVCLLRRWLPTHALPAVTLLYPPVAISGWIRLRTRSWLPPRFAVDTAPVARTHTCRAVACLPRG